MLARTRWLPQEQRPGSVRLVAKTLKEVLERICTERRRPLGAAASAPAVATVARCTCCITQQLMLLFLPQRCCWTYESEPSFCLLHTCNMPIEPVLCCTTLMCQQWEMGAVWSLPTYARY